MLSMGTASPVQGRSLTNSPLSQTHNTKKLQNMLKEEHQGHVEIELKRVKSPEDGQYRDST